MTSGSFFQRCPVPSKKNLELIKLGPFFPKMPQALQKYLNTRKIFRNKKDAYGHFSKVKPQALITQVKCIFESK